MAVGTKDLASEQLRGMDDDRLADALRKSKEELFNLRFQSATGQLDNHGRLRAVKKDIARIYTEMRERELGIGSAPAAPRPQTTDESDESAETTDDADKKAAKAEKAEKKAAKTEKKSAKKAEAADEEAQA